MKYTYLVVYSIKVEGSDPLGVGSVDVDLNQKITDIEHVRAIEEKLKEKLNAINIVITNFVLLGAYCEERY